MNQLRHLTADRSRRVAVTGIGMWTPLGEDRESSWNGIIAGQSAVRWLLPPHWTEAAPLPGAPLYEPSNRSNQFREPLVELALKTASEALADARLDLGQLKQLSVGIVFGTSKGGLHTFSRLYQDFRNHGPSGSRNISDGLDEWLHVFPNQGAVSIRQMIGGYGPSLCPVAACATGLAACLRGADLILNGDCDVVLAGSADVSLQPALLGSFRRLGVLSRESTIAAQACRPFDKNRSGFVVGEGAACLVLERMDSAIARGAKCHAEWLGGRMLSDPYGLTQLDPAGSSLRRLLADLASQVSPPPDYINLHGTGTASNDPIECQSIREVLGDSVDDIDCSSLKGGLGHLLGAAGSVELAATVLAIRDQIVPPTVNLLEADPACPLNLTPCTAKYRPIKHAWKLSLGFGGHLAGACLKKFE